MAVKIVPLAEFQDYAAWLTLWREFKPDLSNELAEIKWAEMRNPSSSVLGLVAVDNDTVIGFAHCVVHPSTDSFRPKCYVQELFVTEARRTSGVGKALVKKLRELRESENWESVYLKTRGSNERAIDFYTNNGWTKQLHVGFEMS